jgi:hypothetical protein
VLHPTSASIGPVSIVAMRPTSMQGARIWLNFWRLFLKPSVINAACALIAALDRNKTVARYLRALKSAEKKPEMLAVLIKRLYAIRGTAVSSAGEGGQRSSSWAPSRSATHRVYVLK